MKRLYPCLAALVIALIIGYCANSEAERIANYIGPNLDTIPESDISPELVDPVLEPSCDKITKAWLAVRLSRYIPSHVQIRSWGVDEGKAHPLAQIIAHSRGH